MTDYSENVVRASRPQSRGHSFAPLRTGSACVRERDAPVPAGETPALPLLVRLAYALHVTPACERIISYEEVGYMRKPGSIVAAVRLVVDEVRANGNMAVFPTRALMPVK